MPPADMNVGPATGPVAKALPGAPDRKLGLLLLAGIVIDSMIGGGTFNLPQNMSNHAGLIAIGIAWAITLVGMYFLSNSFRVLADKRPDLKAGIYTYAQAGFGPFAGFQMCWGYWLSSVFGNTAFAVLIMQILGFFFPVFGAGQTWPAIIGASLLIWVMCGVVMLGVKRTAILNVFASVLNITSILAALVIMAFFVTGGNFTFDMTGKAGHLGSMFTQVKSTMLVTLWVFIGIEAAVVVSDRARRMSDVGPATFIGLGVCTLLYSALSILPFGIMHQSALSQLANPSAAYVLQQVVGRWGAVFVNISLLLSVLACWLAWTILVAELPFEGAKGGVFPKFLARENRFHAPSTSLLVSSSAMQITLFVVLFAHNAWLWLVDITGVMILPPYFFSTLYLSLYALKPGYVATHSESRNSALVTGILASLYAAWLLYAAGPEFILMSTIIFSVGVPIFWWARREHAPAAPAFAGGERIATLGLVGVGVLALVLFARGIIGIS